MAHIALCMMVKDEEKVIRKTLDSCKPYVDSIYILDTGSTDATVAICRDEYGAHILQEPFVDFMRSRNVLMEWAEFSMAAAPAPPAAYLLLMDANDELVRGENLRKVVEAVETNPDVLARCGGGIMLQQKWHYDNASNDTYFNVRLVKAGMQWRYKSPVHEYICRPDGEPQVAVRVDGETIQIFQDRTRHCESSGKRFVRDREILMNEWKREPKNARTLFYLAQTCGCLGTRETLEEAYFFYKLRLEEGGFEEERFHSYLRLGDVALRLGLGHDVALDWWHRALRHSLRVEPLVRIASYHTFTNTNHALANMYTTLACELEYPVHCTLFVNRAEYAYTRWHLHGINCYYLKKYAAGLAACDKAIAERDQAIDKSNREFYVRALQEETPKA
jgi:glycosyltransferase involved in cell wall biosynthesis